MGSVKQLSIGTNIAMGHPFGEALAILKSAGYEYVEISSIHNMCEHADPRFMNEEYAALFRQQLCEHGLGCFAIAGHVDLTEEPQLNYFLKKIEFAARIGAKFVNTNSGPKSRLAEFRVSIRRVIKQAEKWGITVCLESHGDIVDTAKDGARILKEINHPLIRLNYDTGNTYFYQKGKISIEEDIKEGFEFLEHVHLKDISISGNSVRYRPLGKGDLNFPAIFNSLKALGREIPIGIEIPIFVSGTLDQIGPLGYPMPADSIREAARDSLAYVRDCLNN